MKRFALIIATTLLMAVGTPFLVPVVAAQTTPIPTLSLTIVGETNNSKQVFSKNLILLPELPYNLVITFHNGDPVMAHSFTIADVNGTAQINHAIVDEKGLVYAVDRMTGGLYILRYTGKDPLD